MFHNILKEAILYIHEKSWTLINETIKEKKISESLRHLCSLKYYIIATWKEKRYRIHRILVVRIPVIDMKYKQNETELNTNISQISTYF